MTPNQRRGAVLASVLRAAIDRDRDAMERLLTEDVRAWTPALATTSRADLIGELERRDESFTDVELTVDPLDVVGDLACVEWTVEMTHTGDLRFDHSTIVEASGLRITVHGCTIAEFVDDRICSLRQYWDELSILEQLGVVTRNE